MPNRIYKILLFLWFVLMITVSSIPKLSVPKIDSPIGLDKLAHFIEYFILSFFVFKAFEMKNIFDKKIIGFGLLILPLLDELHQHPIPGRQFSLFDILADLLGIVAFAFISWIFVDRK